MRGLGRDGGATLTICVAVSITNVGMYPLLRFGKPAVIIATESRISDTSGRVLTDRGQKTFALSDFAIAGFSGDVQIAYRALNALMAELARLPVKPTDVVGRAEVLLKGEWNYEKRDKLVNNLGTSEYWIPEIWTSLIRTSPMKLNEQMCLQLN